MALFKLKGAIFCLGGYKQRSFALKMRALCWITPEKGSPAKIGGSNKQSGLH